MPDTSTACYRFVHIGAFDLASYGDQLYPLISAHELGSRLEGAEVLPFGPLGSVDDDASGTGACWALGRWSEPRARQIADRATVVLCGGGELVYGDGRMFAPFYGIGSPDAEWLAIDHWFLECLGPAEARCPTVWHAPGVPEELSPSTAARLRDLLAERSLVAVRDERSRRLLEAANIDREIGVVPDTALLLPRVLSSSMLDAERQKLREEGHYPEPVPGSKVLVVQGNHTMTGLVDELAPALDQLPAEYQVVTVSVSPCHNDRLFARALTTSLTRRTWDVPVSTSLEGVAAALAGADCFLGVSLHGALTSIAYGRPTVTLDPFRQAKLASFLDLAGVPERRAADPAQAVNLAADLAQRHSTEATEPHLPALDRLQQRIDTHFDKIADLALAHTWSLRTTHGGPTPEPVSWSDTGRAHQLMLRGLPRPLAPLPRTTPPALRRPDCQATADELRATVAEATTVRRARREADQADAQELEALRAENADLRGAIAHLEGVSQKLTAQLTGAEIGHADEAGLDRLRAENTDLRGAIAHLEGVTCQLESQLDRAAARRNPVRRLRRGVR